jgi:predicted membrane metal-binding protein
MTRARLRFWGFALGLALLFAAATALLFPYEALRLTSPPDRARAWLLTLWTAGVLAILFGVAGLLTFASPLGFREVHDAGSITEAREARRRARLAERGFHDNFAWWLVCTGLILIALYFVAWGTKVQF